MNLCIRKPFLLLLKNFCFYQELIPLGRNVKKNQPAITESITNRCTHLADYLTLYQKHIYL